LVGKPTKCYTIMSDNKTSELVKHELFKTIPKLEAIGYTLRTSLQDKISGVALSSVFTKSEAYLPKQGFRDVCTTDITLGDNYIAEVTEEKLALLEDCFNTKYDVGSRKFIDMCVRLDTLVGSDGKIPSECLFFVASDRFSAKENPTVILAKYVKIKVKIIVTLEDILKLTGVLS